MKKLLGFIFILTACHQKKEPGKDLSQQAIGEIISADTAMSNLATRIGFFQALSAYAEDSVIIPRVNRFPLRTKSEADSVWASRPVIKELTWKPITAHASVSGDMGYSFGYASYVGKDTTTYTNYCTIWKKQKDGSWKFVYDAGNDIPKPPGW
jgi:ketosteroid isomerase-like protein